MAGRADSSWAGKPRTRPSAGNLCSGGHRARGTGSGWHPDLGLPCAGLVLAHLCCSSWGGSDPTLLGASGTLASPLCQPQERWLSTMPKTEALDSNGPVSEVRLPWTPVEVRTAQPQRGSQPVFGEGASGPLGGSRTVTGQKHICLAPSGHWAPSHSPSSTPHPHLRAHRSVGLDPGHALDSSLLSQGCHGVGGGGHQFSFTLWGYPEPSHPRTLWLTRELVLPLAPKGIEGSSFSEWYKLEVMAPLRTGRTFPPIAWPRDHLP